VVMNNASYHSTLSEDYPKTNTKKADIQQWLKDRRLRGQFFSSWNFEWITGTSQRCDTQGKKIRARWDCVTIGTWNCTFATISLSTQSHRAYMGSS